MKAKFILISAVILMIICSLNFVFAWSSNHYGTYYNNSCYQEFTNIATSCGGLNTGNYYISSNWLESTNNLIDGDWSTFSEQFDTASPAYIISNYTAISKNAIWEVKYGNTGIIQNYTIPLNCISNVISVKLNSTYLFSNSTNHVIGYCFDYTLGRYNNIFDSGSIGDNYVYEEAIIWNNDSLTSENLTFTNTAVSNNFNVIDSNFNTYSVGDSYINYSLTSIPTSLTYYVGLAPVDTVSIAYCRNSSSNSWINIGQLYNSNLTINLPASCQVSNLQLYFNMGIFGGSVDKLYEVVLNGINTNFVRYLSIQSNTILTNGFMNLSGNATNPSIFIGNNLAWNYSNSFNTSVQTNNLANLINNYLSTCSYSNGYCQVPFVFHSDTSGTLNYNNLIFNNTGFTENNITYNPTTYVSTNENYLLNVSYDYNNYQSSANFTYNGTTYTSNKATTATGAIFSNSLGINLPIGNKSFYWTVYLTNLSGGINSFNSSINNQSVSNINFTICNSNNNVTYLNISFMDENTGLPLNATMDLANFFLGTNLNQYIFSNTTLNNNYAFCFSPPNKNIQTLIQYFQYSSTGYPQRSYYFSGNLSNSSTNQVLYLLGNGQGIYSTFSTTFNNQPVSGVTLQIERQFNGVWTLLTQGITDSSGSATFYLNPNYQHRITAIKTGYATQQVLVSPSQSLYTIQMQTTGNYSYVSTIDGLSWTIFPGVGLLSNISYNFGFNITSSKNNLIKCRFDLMNGTNVIGTNENIATPSSCSAFVTLNPSKFNYKQLKGVLYIDIGNGYEILEGDAYWIFEPTNSTGMTISDFFKDVANFDLSYFGNDETHREYTMIVLFFLATMILMAFLSRLGWDLTSNGGTILVLLIMTWIASIPGFLTLSGVSPFPFIDKFFIAICLSMFVGGWSIRNFT